MKKLPDVGIAEEDPAEGIYLWLVIVSSWIEL